MGAIDWNWKYTGSDLADWFDEQDEKHWKLHDEWLIEAQRVGDANPIFVFAAWFNDRMTTLPSRVGSTVASGFADALRLGNDFDPDAGFWGTTKGVVLNLLRVITVLQPATSGLKSGAVRAGGIRAAGALADIPGANGACAYVGINNVLSYISGKTVQLFASVADIEKVIGANAGATASELLSSSVVKTALEKLGITAKVRSDLLSIKDVLKAAARSDGPLAFSVEWIDANHGIQSHRLLAAKDAAGAVRLLDYVPAGKQGMFEGFTSLADILAVRKSWGSGFMQAKLILNSPIHEFVGGRMALLEFADASLSLALPVLMGVKWNTGHTPDERMREMARSAFEFKKARLPLDAPPPPVPSVLPQLPDRPLVPREPDASRKRLANSPLAPEAQYAPRIDWLTGVQYRLKYLNYYRGPVSGHNDAATKAAVLAFQKHWFPTRSDWDAIPGPRTQAALYAAIGW